MKTLTFYLRLLFYSFPFRQISKNNILIQASRNEGYGQRCHTTKNDLLFHILELSHNTTKMTGYTNLPQPLHNLHDDESDAVFLSNLAKKPLFAIIFHRIAVKF